MKLVLDNSMASGASSESRKRCRRETSVPDGYNNHILVRQCQVHMLKGKQGIPDQIVLNSSPIALSHTAEGTCV